VGRSDPTLTISRVIETTRADQVEDNMTGQCMFALATACNLVISGERLGLENRTLGLRRLDAPFRIT
jgi:hypothetical protein